MWRRLRHLQWKDLFAPIGFIGIACEEMRLFGEPSETLLLLFAAMIGLPLVLRADEQRQSPPSTPDTPSGQDSSAGNEALP